MAALVDNLRVRQLRKPAVNRRFSDMATGAHILTIRFAAQPWSRVTRSVIKSTNSSNLSLSKPAPGFGSTEFRHIAKP